MKKSPFAWHSHGVVHCLHLGLTMLMGLVLAAVPSAAQSTKP